jgi:holo-[acyl-carrier protein] synthase
MSGIVGIGLDLIDVAHFRVHYGDADTELLARCFTDGEIAETQSGQDRLERLAARFAAKEAAFKALAGGAGIAHTDIEVLRDESGQPQLRLHGAAKLLAQQHNVGKFLVSLTHSASAAAAVVIALSSGPK